MKLTKKLKDAGWTAFDDGNGNVGIQKPTAYDDDEVYVIQHCKGKEYDLFIFDDNEWELEDSDTLANLLEQTDVKLSYLPSEVMTNDPYTKDDCPEWCKHLIGKTRVVFVKESKDDVVACFLDMEENYGIGNGGYKMVGFVIVGQTCSLPLDYAHTNPLATEEEWLPVIEAMKNHTGWCEEVDKLDILNPEYLK